MSKFKLKNLLPLAAMCLSMPILFAPMLSAPSLYAQSSTQGAIGGTVFDATNAVVPKASVTVHNDGTNQDIQLTADDSGFFKAPLLEPGSYTVTTTAAGFEAHKDTVIVQVGQVTNVAPHLGVTGTAESVSVTADVPVLNFDSPDFQSNINKRAINDIPINNRRWSALALLTPGVTVDSSGFGLISVRGISTILNNIEIDGADDNQAYFAEERGRTREAYSTSASAVREFAGEHRRLRRRVRPRRRRRHQLRHHRAAPTSSTVSSTATIANRSSTPSTTRARFRSGRAPAGVSHQRAVQAKGHPQNLRLHGRWPDHQGQALLHLYLRPAQPHLPAFGRRGQSGGWHSRNNTIITGLQRRCRTLHCPVLQACNTNNRLRDRSHRHAGYQHPRWGGLHARRPPRSHPGNYALWRNNAYHAGHRTLLDYRPRPDPAYVGYQEINTPKLDYQLNSKQHIEALYHRLRWDSPGGVQTNATGSYAFDSSGTDFVKLDYGLAKLTSLLRSNLSNEVLYQYGRELNDEGQYPFSAYSTQVLQQADGNIPYVNLNQAKNGAFFGSPYYSYRPKYPDERKWQIGDTLYLSKGNNSFKFGVDIVHNYDLTNQAQYYEGYYQYSSNLANYFADLGSKGTGTCDSAISTTPSTSTGNAVGTYPCYNKYEQGFGPTTFDFSTLDYGFFGQDNYKITPRLTLELGLRYDYEKQPNAVASLTAPTGTFVPYNGIGNNPSDKNNFGPRIGFSYDLYGTGLTVLRGGFGMYYGRVTNGNIGTVLATTGSPLAQSSPNVTNTAASLGNLPYFGTRYTAAQEKATPQGYFRAANLQNPQVMEYDLQLQQQFAHSTFVQVSYLGAQGRELPNFLNVNLNPATVTNTRITVVDTTGKSPLPNGTVLNIPTYTTQGNTALLGPSAGNFTSITEYLSNVNSSYNAVAFEVQNRSLRSVQFDASYTWSHSLDFSQNASSATSVNSWYDPFGPQRVNYGNSQFNVPNRFVGYALYNFPNLIGEKHGLKYLTNDWSLDNSFQFQTGLNYSAAVSGNASSASIQGSLNGAGGPTFIPQLGHNTYTFNRILVDDIRVEKQFPITDRYHVQVFLQAFNVANHQNETAVNGTAFQLQASSGTAGLTNGTATYQANFGTVNKTNNSGFSYTPRQLELAARLFF